MKINYIVNVDLGDKQARAVQISSNAKEFYNKLGDDFKLITPTTKKFNFNYPIWVSNIKVESNKLRKLLFHIGAIKSILEADVVYSRNLSILYLANLFGKRIVWEMHDGISGTNLKIFNKIKDNLKIVVISQALKDYIYKKFDYKKDIIVVHDGVFLEKYDNLRDISKQELRKNLNLPLNKTIIMHTGSLYEGRGAELFEVIIKKHPDLYFVQVGGNEQNIAKWKDYYKDYENILFIGHQDNDSLVKYQMSADLLFYPITKQTKTWWCCSPMKIFEYMATGIPILASNLGSVGEVLTNDNSIVFNPENEQTIRDGIKYFLENREKCTQLAQNALIDIRKKYTWEKRIENILEFIK